MARYKTEMERIAAARRLAEEEIKSMPPEAVEQWGYANILSDLVHEYLMSMPSSQELIDGSVDTDLDDEEKEWWNSLGKE